MTRFARSKGSKASNERIEEESTPWEQLKAPITAKKHHFDVEDLDDDGFDLEETKKDTSTKNNSDSELSDDEDDNINALENISPQDDLENNNGEVIKKKKKRSQNKCLNCKEPGHLKKDCPKLSEERRKELQELCQLKVERKGKGTGRKKKKRKADEYPCDF